MITRIREVRRAKRMTLEDVARKCSPATTAQTIGRLETGTRTVSVSWLNRIAEALGVSSADLIDLPGQERITVAAVLGANGAHAPSQSISFSTPAIDGGLIGVRVDASIGDYRTGDELWCNRIMPDQFATALNRDILVPRPGGRYLFGRLIDRDSERLQILPLVSGARQQVVVDPAWIAIAVRLIRAL
jgi:transcriptional regulator with XRE-family HTH domain